MKKHTSQSELKQFQKCKRSWFIKYLLGYSKIFAPGPMSLGNYVHAGMEHRDGDWREFVTAEAEKDYEALDEILHADVAKQHSFAEIIIEGWLPWLEEEAVDAGVEVLASEMQMAIDMGDYVLMGKIDELVMLPNGDVLIRDWKTAQGWDLIRLADIDLQFRTYLMMLLYISDFEFTMPTQGQWIIAKKVKRTARAKPPFYAKHTTNYTAETIRSTEKLWDAVMRDMLHLIKEWETEQWEHHQLFPPNPSFDCNRCEYKDVCSMFDDGSDAEGYLAEWYEHRDANERYTDVQILGTRNKS